MARKKKVDVKYLGIPNVCFSLTKKSDYREKKFSRQRMTRGFDESETWSLDSTICEFVLPRLKLYREIIGKTIINHGGFFQKVDKMIVAFELLGKDWTERTARETKKIREGLGLFAENLEALWW